jgi:hypothetical protein
MDSGFRRNDECGGIRGRFNGGLGVVPIAGTPFETAPGDGAPQGERLFG